MCKFCRIIVAVIICIFYSAYALDSVKDLQHLAEDYQGILGMWESKTRGELLCFYESEEKKLMLARYQFTPISMLPEQPPFEINITDLRGVKFQDGSLCIGEVEYQRTNKIDYVFPKALGTQIENFDVLVETFKQHYAFFNIRNIDWNNLVNHYRGKISNEMTNSELFQIFKEMLSQIQDNHVALAQGLDENSEKYFGFSLRHGFHGKIEKERLSFVKNRNQDIELSDYVDETTNRAVKSIEDNYLLQVYKDPANKVIWGCMKESPDIGYFNLLSMEGKAPDELKEILDNVIGYFNENRIKSLIIDVRFNQGGDDAMSIAIAERFAHAKTVAFTTQTYYGAGALTEKKLVYLEPEGKKQIWQEGIEIFLLTSPITASAAESFVMAMSALSNITRIGESTMGILSDQFARKLPNGWWVMLSNEICLTPAGELFESSGIPPHIKADFPFISFSSLGQDPGLNLVQERFR